MYTSIPHTATTMEEVYYKEVLHYLENYGLNKTKLMHRSFWSQQGQKGKRNNIIDYRNRAYISSFQLTKGLILFPATLIPLSHSFIYEGFQTKE